MTNNERLGWHERNNRKVNNMNRNYVEEYVENGKFITTN